MGSKSDLNVHEEHAEEIPIGKCLPLQIPKEVVTIFGAPQAVVVFLTRVYAEIIVDFTFSY